jgi:Opioid growth factor receptor (OGFr) conserved region
MLDGTVHDLIPGFYSGNRPDSRGRYIEEIWTFDDYKLEHVHDYIQWLFPLLTRSRFNPDAPILTQQSICAFHQSQFLRSQLQRSIEVLLKFYGFETVKHKNGTLEIARSPEFAVKSRIWLEPENHNHLRLTRIVTSSGILGLESYATAILARLKETVGDFPQSFSEQTVKIWSEISNDPDYRGFE